MRKKRRRRRQQQQQQQVEIKTNMIKPSHEWKDQWNGDNLNICIQSKSSSCTSTVRRFRTILLVFVSHTITSKHSSCKQHIRQCLCGWHRCCLCMCFHKKGRDQPQHQQQQPIFTCIVAHVKALIEDKVNF